MALRLVPEILNAIDVIMPVCKQLTMVDSVVPEIRHIQCIVAAPGVRIHDAVRYDLVLHNIHQGVRSSIGYDLRINLATALQYAKYRHFTRRTSTPLAFTFTTKITFINLYFALKRRLVINGRTDQLSEAMKIVGSSAFVHTHQ